MSAIRIPFFDLEKLDHLSFQYDWEDDIAIVHINGPRAALTEPVDDGWYLRITDEAVAGLEIHGFKRSFLATPFYAAVSQPAIRELERAAGRSIDDENILVDGSSADLPATTRLVVLLVGQALAKYEALLQAEFEDAGRELLRTGLPPTGT